MARYALDKNFVLLAETAGVIVNVSNVKVEVSETAQAGTGVILRPNGKIRFNKRLYAARAPNDCGVAVIGVLQGTGTSGGSGGTIVEIPDEPLDSDDLYDLFNGATDDDNIVTDADWHKVFSGRYVTDDDDKVTDDDWRKIFGR